MEKVEEREKKVRSMLHKDAAGALKVALEDPPVGLKDHKTIKSKSVSMVLLVLNSIREEQMGPTVDGLTDPELDLLMKFIYAGLARPQNNGPLFKWHAKVLQKAGVGAVARAVAERRTVQ